MLFVFLEDEHRQGQRHCSLSLPTVAHVVYLLTFMEANPESLALMQENILRQTSMKHSWGLLKVFYNA